MVPILFEEKVLIPGGIDNLEAFRRWARSDDFPERGRFAYLRGKLWMDMSMEQIFSHNQVKGCINAILYSLVDSSVLGYYLPDGMLLSNPDVDLSTVPDGMFVSYEGLQRGQARLIEGAEGGFVELEGTPEMVLEVVSSNSVRKDTETLRELYWKARISEYWMVDAREAAPRFTIRRRDARGYVAGRNQAGWIKSNVFGRSFRFTQQTDPLGNPKYSLAVRP